MSIKFNLQEKSTLFNFAQKFETRFLKFDEFNFAQPVSVRNSCPSLSLYFSLCLFLPLSLSPISFLSLFHLHTHTCTHTHTLSTRLSTDSAVPVLNKNQKSKTSKMSKMSGPSFFSFSKTAFSYFFYSYLFRSFLTLTQLRARLFIIKQLILNN